MRNKPLFFGPLMSCACVSLIILLFSISNASASYDPRSKHTLKAVDTQSAAPAQTIFVDNGGLVGIGNPNPSAKLDVNGNVIINGTTTMVNDLTINGTVLVVDTANNKVGVNDASPSNALSVTGDISTTGVLQTGQETVAAYSRLGAGTTGHSLGAADDLLISDDFEVDGSSFFDGSVTVAGTTLINNSGNANTTIGNANNGAVAINASTLAIDTADWDISNTGVMTGIGAITSNGALTVNGAVSIGVNGSKDYATDNGDLYVEGDFEVDGNIHLGDMHTDTLTIESSLTMNGEMILNNGIDMQTKLIENIGHANTDFTTGGGLTIKNDLAVNGSNFVVDVSAASVGLGDATPNSTLEVVRNGATVPFMLSNGAAGDGDYIIVAANGDVGINKASPATLLDLNGSLNVTGATTIGNGSATVAINSSDWDINATGDMTGIGAVTAAGTMLVNTTGTANTTIGNSAGGTITVGATTGSNLVLDDANWNITGAGAANFVSVGAVTPGTAAFTTLASTGVTTIGNDSATVAINSSDWDINATGDMTGIGAITAAGTILLNTSGTTDTTIGNAAGGTTAINAATIAINSSDWDINSTGNMAGIGSFESNGAMTVNGAVVIGTNALRDYANGTGDLYVAGDFEVDGNIHLGDMHTDTLTIESTLTMNGEMILNNGINMQTKLIENIGHANTDFTAGGGLTVENDFAVNGDNLFVDVSAASVGIGDTSPNASLELVRNGSTVPFMLSNGADGDYIIVAANGDVGINDTTPAHLLDINGSLGVTGISTLTDDLIINGTVLVVDTANNKVGVNDASPSNALSVAGDISGTGVLQTGQEAVVAYSRLGAGTTGHGLAAADDLLVSSDFEVDGSSFFDSAVTITGTTIIGNDSATVAINSSDWDIESNGDMTGIGSIVSNGNLTIDGTDFVVDVIANSVGLGDATPNATLEIVQSATTKPFMISNGSDGDYVSVVANGDVGISNTSPSATLDVTGSINGTSLSIDSATTLGDLTVVGTTLINNSGGSDTTIGNSNGGIISIGASTNSHLVLDDPDWNISDAGAANLTSIGATTIGSARFTSLASNGTTTIGNGSATVAIDSNDWDITTGGNMTGIGSISADGQLSLTGSSANISLGSNYLSGDGSDEGITVDANGNIGINDNTPNAMLHVNGSVIIEGGGPQLNYVLTANSDNGDSSWQSLADISMDEVADDLDPDMSASLDVNGFNLIDVNDISLDSISAAANGTNISVNIGSNNLLVNADTLVVTGSDKRVGINDASPDAQLDVNGSLNVTGVTTIGNNSATVTIDSSDWDINATGDMTGIGAITAAGTALLNTTGSADTTIGNSTGGTITVGATTGSNLILDDANWNITGAGAANLTSIGATTPGTASFTTLASTGATTIGNNSATVAINSSDWDISSTGDATGLGSITSDNDLNVNGTVIIGVGGTRTLATSNGDLYVKGNLEVDGDIHLGDMHTDTLTIDSSLTMNGAMTFNNGVDMNSYLITNIGNAGTDFTVNGGLTLNEDLIVNGNNLFVDVSAASVGIKDESPSNTLTVNGAASVSSVLQVGQETVAAYSRLGAGVTGHAMNAADDLLISDDLEVDDDTFMDGDLTVIGATAIGNNSATVVIDSSDWNINATGDMTGIGAITADGDLSIDSTDLFVDVSANSVGIGTNSPEDLLEVQAAEATDSIITLDADDGDDNADTWELRSDASDNQFYITNHVSDLMTVASNGDVGIGTSSPGAKLEVAGNILSTGTIQGQSLTINGAVIGDNQTDFFTNGGEDGGANRSLGNNDNYSLGFETNGITIATFDNNGNFGIADTSPDYLLDVNGTLGVSGTLTMNGANIALNTNYLSGDGGNEGIYVDSLGKVGIGTNSPDTALDILSGDIRSLEVKHSTTDNAKETVYLQNTNAGGQTALTLENNRGSSATYGGLIVGGSTTAAGSIFGVNRQDKMFIYADGANNLGLYVGTLTADPFVIGTNDLERLRIDATGKVGIANDSPSTALDVTGTINATDLTIDDDVTITDALGVTGLSTLGAITAAGTALLNTSGTANTTIGNSAGGTTAINSAAVAINSNDWDITSEGVMTGIDEITTNGDITLSGNSANIVLGNNYISGDGENEGISVATNGDVTFSGAINVLGNITYLTITSQNGNLIMNGNSANIVLGSNFLSGDGQDEGVFVDGNGNIGIGTNSPESLLEIQGSEGEDAIITLDADDGDDNDDTWKLRSEASDNNFYITNHTSDLFTIASSGNTGINDASPDALLDVNGSLNVTGVATIGDNSSTVAINSSDWDINATGDMTGIGAITAAGTALLNTTGTADTTIGNAAGGTITVGATTGSNLILDDANWNISGAGAANFVSVGAVTPGTASFTTLASTGVSTIGNNSATVAINSSDWDINATGDMTGIGAITSNGNLTVNGAVAIGVNGSKDYATNNGDLYIEGDLEVDGDIHLGDMHTDTLTVQSSLNMNGDINMRNGIDMATQLIENIGHANTDFTTGGGLTLQDDLVVHGTDLVVDASAASVGLGDATPEATLEIVAAAGTAFMLSNGAAGDGDYVIIEANGDIGVNDTTPDYVLDVNGTVGISGATRLTSTFNVNGTTVIGDNSSTVAINSNDWDINATGDMTGIGAITAAGTALLNTSGTANTTIGNSAGGTITVGASTGSDLVLDDANWNISGAGAANLTSIGATTPGTASFTTLASTGVTTIGNGSATVAINSSDWDIDATGVATGLGNITSDGVITTTGDLVIDTTDFVVDVSADSVGLGDATPNATLEVVAGAGTAFMLSNGAAGDGDYVIIEANGDIGVNDTTPDYLLDVNGTVGISGATRLTSTLNVNGTTVIGDNSATVAINSSDWDINATGDMTGIGAITAAGTALLNTSGTADTTIGNSAGGTITIGASTGSNLVLDDANWNIAGAGTANFVSIGAGTAGTGAFTTLASTGVTTIGNNSATVAIDSSDWNINATGDMTGIGEITAAGTALLNTSGTADTTIGNAAGGTTAINAATVAINSGDWDINATGDMTGIGNITSDGVITTTDDLVIDTTDFVVDVSADSVGLGDATPNATLEVVAGAGTAFMLSNGAAGDGDYVIIEANGDIGVNDTTPDYVLDVNGTVGISGATRLTSTFNVNGTTVIGDNSSTVAINSNDWDINATGDMTGIGAITAAGTALLNTSGTADTTIGNSAGGTITVGATTGSNLILDDANWNISGAGAANLTSIGAVAPGTASFTTLASTGVTTIGNNSATVAIDSSDWNINVTGDMTGIGAITSNGNLTVNGAIAIGVNGSKDYATNNGDLYIEGDLEVDGDIHLGDMHTDTLTVESSLNMNGDINMRNGIDMATQLIENIGHANTDFTTGGGLTIKDDLAVNGSNFVVDVSAASVGLGDATPEATLEVVAADGTAFMLSNGAAGDGDYVIIEANGDIGVNDTTPDYVLDVNGTVGISGATRLTSTFNVNGTTVIGDNSSTVAINSSDWDINATGDMTGIGAITAAGTALLNTSGTANTTIGNSAGGTITVGATTGSNLILDDANWNISGAGAANLTSLGAVTPGTASFTTLASTGVSTIGNNSATVAINSSDWDIDATGVATGLGNITSDGVITTTGDLVIDTTDFVVDVSADSVGLGDATPNATLEVVAGAGTAFMLSNGAAGDGDYVIIEANGDIGVNDTTPDYVLDVNGTVGISGATRLTSTFNVNGTTVIGDNSATVAINSSDWDINATGDMTGIGAITAAGTALLNTSGTADTTIGNSAGGTITIGASTGSNLVLDDANWNIAGAGTANFVSIGAGTAGTGAFTTLASTGVSTIGNNSATVAINSSDWDIDATGIATGLGNITSDGVITTTGDLVIDTTDFVVDVSANSVGLGDATPDATLELVAGAGTPFMLSNGAAGDGDYVIVAANGDVGIGITSPAALLHVNGQIAITGGSPAANKYLQSTDDNGLAQWVLGTAINEFNDGGDTAGGNRTLGNNNAYDLNFETNGSPHITILANGDVGIGDITPDSFFEVNGNSLITGTLDATSSITGSSLVTSNLTIDNGTIVDSGGTINFVDTNLETNGDLTAASLVTSTMTIDNGMITVGGGIIHFNGDDLTTNGAVIVGEGYGQTGVTISAAGAIQADDSITSDTSFIVGNTTFSNGDINNTDNTMDFNDDAITTTGTLAAGATTLNGKLKLVKALALPIDTINGDTTLDNDYYTVIADANAAPLTVTLPVCNAGNKGLVYVIKKSDANGANAVTIDADGAETIDGAATKSFTTQYQGYTVHCDGAATWWAI